VDAQAASMSTQTCRPSPFCFRASWASLASRAAGFVAHSIIALWEEIPPAIRTVDSMQDCALNAMGEGEREYPEVAGELGMEPVEEGLVVEAIVRHGDLPALRCRPVAQYLDQRLLVRAPSCHRFNSSHHRDSSSSYVELPCS
jgi:hypothetical protein